MTVSKFTVMRGGGKGSGLIEAGIKMLRTLTGTRREQQQLNRELRGPCLISGDSEGQKEMFVSPGFNA